ncbi:hypothetical protein PAXRUDRAFT_172109, partial [Paxillus rubicundulus Ve08.2h10]
FRVINCFQWPQLYCVKYEYAICIPQQDTYPWPNPLHWAWYTPTADDFQPLHDASVVGTLKEEKAEGLKSLYKIAHTRVKKWQSNCGNKKDIVMKLVYGLRHDIMILGHHPLT